MDIGALSSATLFLTIVLMFIGASPGSTGGGIKTSTMFVLLVLIRSVFYGRNDVNAFHRRIPLSIVRNALSIFLISLSLLVLGAMLLSVLEEAKNFDLLDLVFEEASALGTVGLTSVGTWNLTNASQVWLILLMYFGRVGPLTMMLSFSRRYANQTQGMRFAEEQLIVG